MYSMMTSSIGEATLCHSLRSEIHYKENPRRHMWKPRWGAIPSVQSPKARLLLANHKDGLHGIRSQVRQVQLIHTMPLLNYVTPSEVKYIIREIHEGTCRNHTEGQSLVFKALRQGYYWPTMKTDCMEYARKCNKCKQFAPILKAHQEELMSMTSPWPFAVWGIYLIGQLPKRRGSVQYTVVAVDYFTKWVEAEALKSIMPAQISRSSSTRTSSASTESPTLWCQIMEHSSTTMNSRSSAMTSRSRKSSRRSHGLRPMGRSKL